MALTGVSCRKCDRYLSTIGAPFYHQLQENKMPLNKKGKTIKAAMKREYGAKKGEQVFYASENKGTIKNVTKKKK